MARIRTVTNPDRLPCSCRLVCEPRDQLLHADDLCVGAHLPALTQKLVTKGELGDGRADRCSFAGQFGSGILHRAAADRVEAGAEGLAWRKLVCLFPVTVCAWT